ncbi:uncharacterized protein LOC131246005 isoform X3 [Magnolia sinica]|uniref:uncharacterized protein LOC131246005 isoform X3 n=1 Tax=Magnolia sinica TaxID=86752 RepID=UPI002658E16D|nr:uncharacterized protein LOC131246005 isoform X3 [Magnolia sinica]XP_058101836.1 uncharacterized protein LOC131246005 isoform X3 [Magnolia sinica]XP_058101837.1 uncharacterized protein LOC131246005 isoform X3 [Magnolia sinica]
MSDPLLPSSDQPGVYTQEFHFYEKVKERLLNPDTYQEFLKCLHLHLSGPLISAVTVKSSGDNGLSAGAVVGTVAGCCVVIGLILAFLWMKCFVGGKDRIDKVQAGGRLVLSYDLDLVYNTNQKLFLNDRVINSTPVDVLQGQEWESISWKKLQVGDLVRVNLVLIVFERDEEAG